jgi:hypothetical protein
MHFGPFRSVWWVRLVGLGLSLRLVGLRLVGLLTLMAFSVPKFSRKYPVDLTTESR